MAVTKLPRLYVNGAFERIVNAVSCSISQNIIPLSSAVITLPADENLPARSWVELFTPYGSAGMYRVRSPHDAYGQSTTTAELEHMVSEVGDYLVREEKSEMMTATDAVRRAFSFYGGNRWKLGDISALGSARVAYDVNYDRVLDVILGILEQKPDCMMGFNFNTNPWTIKIIKRETAVSAEGRLARNVTSAVVSYDDSELVTRVWYQTFNSKGEGTWTSADADTLPAYGVIEGTVSTSPDMTSEEIGQTVAVYLAEHKAPRVTVNIQAAELSQITGESMDKFLLGNMMRLALPDYGVTVEKNVTAIVWSDVYNKPQSMSVTLGSEEDTVVTFLHNLDSKGAGGGGGGGAKKKEEEVWKEYRTFTEKTDYRIAAEAQRVDKHNNILEQAGLSINSKGVLIYSTDNKNMIGSRIQTESDRISLVVKGTGKNAKVDPANIVMGINGQSGSYVKIKAKTIDLQGYVTMSDFSAVNAKIDNLIGGYSAFAKLRAAAINFGGWNLHLSTIDGNKVVTWGA